MTSSGEFRGDVAELSRGDDRRPTCLHVAAWGEGFTGLRVQPKGCTCGTVRGGRD